MSFAISNVSIGGHIGGLVAGLLASESMLQARRLRQLWLGYVGTALVGSGESVAARLREYVDEGIDTFILSGYPHREEAQRFGRYVMPHFRGEASMPVAPAELVPA